MSVPRITEADLQEATPEGIDFNDLPEARQERIRERLEARAQSEEDRERRNQERQARHAEKNARRQNEEEA